MITRYSICSKKVFQKDGENKTIWLNVGQLVDVDGKKYIELNILPNTPLYAFEQKPKEQVERVEEPSNEPTIDDIMN
jgi:hypothetical protein